MIMVYEHAHKSRWTLGDGSGRSFREWCCGWTCSLHVLHYARHFSYLSCIFGSNYTCPCPSNLPFRYSLQCFFALPISHSPIQKREKKEVAKKGGSMALPLCCQMNVIRIPHEAISLFFPMLQAQCAVGPIPMKGRRDNTKPGLCYGPMAWGRCFCPSPSIFFFFRVFQSLLMHFCLV